MENLFQSLGGLGLFLFGMKIMSEGLQTIAGTKMRKILGTVSNNRLVGCCAGAIVTSIIQSSSATTVILVSFVDSGLMTLFQAVSIILGANIGTTVTAQLIAFKIQDLALPAIAAGVLLKFFMGRRKLIYLGEALLGFGIIFYGMATMKAGFAPLKENDSFILFLTKFNADTLGGIFLCVIAGTAVTMVLQSSSATVGITMTLATQGLLNFSSSVALILGDNIGTTITAELASIGGNIHAKRAARSHTLFNIIGVLIVIIFFPIFIDLVRFVSGTIMQFGPPEMVVDGEWPNIARYIANSHTIFNVINAAFFLLALPYLIKLATFITPQKNGEEEFDELHHIKFLDMKYIGAPSTALTQAREEIIHMGQAVQVMYHGVIRSLNERNPRNLSKFRKREDRLDTFQKEITRYLLKVTQEHISPEESREIRSLLRMVNNLERIGDATEEIAEMVDKFITQNLNLSEDGLKDYGIISDDVQRFLNLVIEAMKNEDREVMYEARDAEKTINKLEENMKERHLIRLQGGICAIDPGVIFVNILTAFKRIGGFCFNIAQAIAGIK